MIPAGLVGDYPIQGNVREQVLFKMTSSISVDRASHPGERMQRGGVANTDEKNTLLPVLSGYGRECLVRMAPGRNHLYPVFGNQNILHEIFLLVQIGWVQTIQNAKRG